ncbi:hypothetical protein CEXT_633521 [Caerostris extrusa]|uniref:Uncharacterized protein n=1 Tax=Caerostris extrusa TaxID=172846 RepID=A0AAV4PDM4_CAEEX|nr:hypothetical protein CEXT_633521 [Caerostris extrusa]
MAFECIEFRSVKFIVFLLKEKKKKKERERGCFWRGRQGCNPSEGGHRRTDRQEGKQQTIAKKGAQRDPRSEEQSSQTGDFRRSGLRSRFFSLAN